MKGNKYHVQKTNIIIKHILQFFSQQFYFIIITFIRYLSDALL